MAVGVNQLRAAAVAIELVLRHVSERVGNHSGTTGGVVQHRGHITQRICLRGRVAKEVVADVCCVAERVGYSRWTREGRRRLSGTGGESRGSKRKPLVA